VREDQTPEKRARVKGRTDMAESSDEYQIKRLITVER